MHSPSAAELLADTPAITKGVARAVRQLVQALATLEQGLTAPLKSCA